MTRLLHLSDLHFGGREHHVPLTPELRLRAVLDAVDSGSPFDAVVVTGDVCDGGSEADAVAAKNLLLTVAPVVLAVPGNHDDTAVISRTFGDPNAALGNWDVVGVSTNVPGQVHGDGRPLSTAVAGLTTNRPAIVLHHHPVHSHSSHPWFTLTHRDGVMAALAEREAPLLMLSGHTHEAFDLRVGPVRFMGAPSSYYGLRHRGDGWEFASPAGANIIELRADGTAEMQLVLG